MNWVAGWYAATHGCHADRLHQRQIGDCAHPYNYVYSPVAGEAGKVAEEKEEKKKEEKEEEDISSKGEMDPHSDRPVTSIWTVCPMASSYTIY